MGDSGLKALWERMTGRIGAAREERAVELTTTMSPAEREFAEERIEDHQADNESEAHVVGGDLEAGAGD